MTRHLSASVSAPARWRRERVPLPGVRHSELDLPPRVHAAGMFAGGSERQSLSFPFIRLPFDCRYLLFQDFIILLRLFLKFLSFLFLLNRSLEILLTASHEIVK